MIAGLAAIAPLVHESIKDEQHRQLKAERSETAQQYAKEVIACVDAKLTDKAVSRVARRFLNDWQSYWLETQQIKRLKGFPLCEEPPYGYRPPSSGDLETSSDCYYSQLPWHIYKAKQEPMNYSFYADYRIYGANTRQEKLLMDDAVSEAIARCNIPVPSILDLPPAVWADFAEVNRLVSEKLLAEFENTARFQQFAKQISARQNEIEQPALEKIAKEEGKLEARKEQERSEALKGYLK